MANDLNPVKADMEYSYAQYMKVVPAGKLEFVVRRMEYYATG